MVLFSYSCVLTRQSSFVLFLNHERFFKHELMYRLNCSVSNYYLIEAEIISVVTETESSRLKLNRGEFRTILLNRVTRYPCVNTWNAILHSLMWGVVCNRLLYSSSSSTRVRFENKFYFRN